MLKFFFFSLILLPQPHILKLIYSLGGPGIGANPTHPLIQQGWGRQAGSCAFLDNCLQMFCVRLNGRRSCTQAAAVSCQRFMLLTSPPPQGNGLNMMQQPRRRKLSALRLSFSHLHDHLGLRKDQVNLWHFFVNIEVGGELTTENSCHLPCA